MKPKTKRNLDNIITYLLVGLVLVGGFISLGYMHEQVHIAIYGHYGIEAKMDWFKYFPTIVTIPNGICPTEMCVLAHNINEVIGYPLQIFYAVGSILIIIFSPRWLQKNPFKSPVDAEVADTDK